MRRRSRGWRRWPARPTRSTRSSSRRSPTATWCRRSGCPIRGRGGERELARPRLHLTKRRSQLKNRIHSALISFGRPCPVTDLFGVAGRELLGELELPEPWRGHIEAWRAADAPLYYQLALSTDTQLEGTATAKQVAALGTEAIDPIARSDQPFSA